MDTIKIALALAALTLFSACASRGNLQTATAESVSSSALVGEWTIEEISGEPVVDRGTAFLGFNEEGRVYGNTSVNKLFGTWTLDAGALELSQLGTTRMAGPEDLMNQESKFLQALGDVAHARLNSEGQLVLGLSSDDAMVIASMRE